MPAAAVKINLAPALKVLSKSLEQTTQMVATLKDGADSEKFSSLQDEASAMSSQLLSVMSPLGTATEVKVEIDETEKQAAIDAEGDTKTLTIATEALERLTSVVDTLKSDKEMEAPEFQQVVKEVISIASKLAAVGERYPEPTSKGVGNNVARTSRSIEDAIKRLQGISTRLESEKLTDKQFAKAVADVARVTGKLEGVVGKVNKGEDLTDDDVDNKPATKPELPKFEDVAKKTNEISEAVEALAKGDITKASLDEVLKRFDDTMLRGGVMLDTGDLEILRKVVEALASVMSTEDIEKSIAEGEAISREFCKTVAAGTKELGKVDAQDKVAAVLKTASVYKAVLQGINETVVAKLDEQRAKQPEIDATAALEAKLEAKIQAAVSKVEEKMNGEITKLTTENKDLRAEIGKRDSEPNQRASTPEPGAGADDVDQSKLFPMNYNAPSTAD